MRVDLDEIAARIARRRAAEAMLRSDPAAERRRRLDEMVTRVSIPFAPLLEGRLLAAIISDPAVHAICALLLVELDDFAQFQHRCIYEAFLDVAPSWSVAAWRNDLPGWTTLALPNLIDAMGTALEALDAKAAAGPSGRTYKRDKVDDLAISELLGRHVWETYGPPGEPMATWVEHDARALRELADRRRAL